MPTPDRTTPGAADFAVLHVPAPVARTIPLDAAALPPGTPVLLAGFSQDRVERLGVDAGCHATGYARVGGAGPFLLHDCEGTAGTRGAPVLARDAAGVRRVTGVQATGRRDGAGGTAVPADALRPLFGDRRQQ